jgi:hypothetical protein
MRVRRGAGPFFVALAFVAFAVSPPARAGDVRSLVRRRGPTTGCRRGGYQSAPHRAAQITPDNVREPRAGVDLSVELARADEHALGDAGRRRRHHASSSRRTTSSRSMRSAAVPSGPTPTIRHRRRARAAGG